MIERASPSLLRLSTICCRWIGRLTTIGYTGFFLFMLIGHLMPGGEPFGILAPNEAWGFVFIGTWFLGLWLAWKWDIAGVVIAVISLFAFRVAVTMAWSLIGIMALPCLFYLAAAILERRFRPGSKPEGMTRND